MTSRQDFATKFYGPLPLNQSQSRPRRPRALISSLSSRDGETILLRARLQTSRAQGNKMVFLNLRQRTDSVQALLTVTPEKVSKQMVKWAASLADESIVLVEGVVRKSPEIIKSASVGDVEVHVTQVMWQTWRDRIQHTERSIAAAPSGFWNRWTIAVLSRRCFSCRYRDRVRRRAVQQSPSRHTPQQPSCRSSSTF